MKFLAKKYPNKKKTMPKTCIKYFGLYNCLCINYFIQEIINKIRADLFIHFSTNYN